MDTLINIENADQETVMTFPQAALLSAFITFSTVLGISHGKHMEKTVNHIEIPSTHNAARLARRHEDE